MKYQILGAASDESLFIRVPGEGSEPDALLAIPLEDAAAIFGAFADEGDAK